jgi:polysaccharide export outer membrane protein
MTIAAARRHPSDAATAPNTQSSTRCHRAILLGLLACFVLLSGCSSLPSSGPTARRIERAAKSPDNLLQFSVVNITPETVAPDQLDTSASQDFLGALGAATNLQRSDVIRIGDTLAVSIYEVGVTLFGNAAATAADFPTANAQRIMLQVDEDGRIALPYLGTLEVAGKTPVFMSNLIEARLREFSESPQVSIAIAESLENSAYLTGAVSRPGRYRLTSARERLLDVIALAGGPSIDVDDAELRLVRGARVATIGLGELRHEDFGNIVVAPGDRIEILKRRRTYVVFGASDKISQVPFEGRKVSLAEAIARVGGPSDTRANPTGVFLFRFENGEDGAPAKPVIYRLDMMDPASYFVSQRFAMHDKDVIFFANSAANPPAKFIGLLNQLFSPILTTRALTQ